MKNRLINIVLLEGGQTPDLKDKKIDSLLADMKSFFITEEHEKAPTKQHEKVRKHLRLKQQNNVGETLEKMLSKKTEACR
jgi:hypothetical protein